VKLYLLSPNTSSWRGAQLNISTGTTLPLPLQYKLWSYSLRTLFHVPVIFSLSLSASLWFRYSRCFHTNVYTRLPSLITAVAIGRFFLQLCV